MEHKDHLSGVENLEGTLFTTANMEGLPTSAGTGTTLTVTYEDTTGKASLTGYAEAISSLKLPPHVLLCDVTSVSKSSTHRSKTGNAKGERSGYIRLVFPEEVLSRYELRDHLNGLGWLLTAYTTLLCPSSLGVLHNEIWVLKVKSRSPRSKPTN